MLLDLGHGNPMEWELERTLELWIDNLLCCYFRRVKRLTVVAQHYGLDCGDRSNMALTEAISVNEAIKIYKSFSLQWGRTRICPR